MNEREELNLPHVIMLCFVLSTAWRKVLQRTQHTIAGKRVGAQLSSPNFKSLPPCPSSSVEDFPLFT